MGTLTRAGGPPQERGLKLRQIKPSVGTDESPVPPIPLAPSGNMQGSPQQGTVKSPTDKDLDLKYTLRLKAMSVERQRDSNRKVTFLKGEPLMLTAM